MVYVIVFFVPGRLITSWKRTGEFCFYFSRNSVCRRVAMLSRGDLGTRVGNSAVVMRDGRGDL